MILLQVIFLSIVKGTQGKYPNQFDFFYSQDSQNYELELKIKLNKVGNYSFFTFESLGFGQLKDCKYFNIDTNIEGTNAEGKIEFVVQ